MKGSVCELVFGYYGFIVRCYTEFSVGIIGGKEMPVSKDEKVGEII